MFGVDAGTLWSGVTARPHTAFKGDLGYYVIWRTDGVHVSRPHSDDDVTSERLSVEAVEDLQTFDYWQRFAASRRLRVVGPSTHSYLDADPEQHHIVETIESAAVEELRALVRQDEWSESGWGDSPPHAFGLYREDVLVAASNLNSFAGQPRDIGVLVASAWRGQGLSLTVGSAAASYAIREYGFARWGVRNSNVPSLAACRRLGFEDWCTQLWVR